MAKTKPAIVANTIVVGTFQCTPGLFVILPDNAMVSLQSRASELALAERAHSKDQRRPSEV